MKTSRHIIQLVAVCACAVTGINVAASETDLIEPLRSSARRAAQEGGQIPAERKRTLEETAQFIRQRLDTGKPAQLTFVCTHNSRRSHFSQVWTKQRRPITA